MEDYVIERNNNVLDAINYHIGLGGGQSFIKKIGSYWEFEYWPGIKIILFRDNENVIETDNIDELTEIKSPNIIEEEVSRKKFMSYARIVWEEKKYGQKKLF